MPPTPELRIRPLNSAPVKAGGDYVLYWMVAFRRTGWNFALQRAVERAKELGKPLLVFEPLRSDYPWASDRLHAFALQGMADNARSLAGSAATYFPFVERRQGEGRGLLRALARRACVVVSDDWPSFFVPAMQRTAARRLDVRLEVVDSNGLLPLAVSDKVFRRAVDFRRFLQKNLAPHLLALPEADPLAGADLPPFERPPAEIVERWPVAETSTLAAEPEALAELPIDHRVRPVDSRGGTLEAQARLEELLGHRLDRYVEGRLDLDRQSASGLSPYLHFGHLSSHEILSALAEHRGWTPDRLAEGDLRGARRGWWGLDENAETFLDQLVTWRELGFNMAWHTEMQAEGPIDTWESLPDWARRTLDEHSDDPREHCYGLEDFEGASTHDPIWNAAQRQLLEDGTLHNYLRMLWGKKILHWSASPQQALDVMIELNNKYALDGRDPNSTSGISWCLGRYDRAWGPERPIFGKIRYMSSDSTRRKMDLTSYLERYG